MSKKTLALAKRLFAIITESMLEPRFREPGHRIIHRCATEIERTKRAKGAAR